MSRSRTPCSAVCKPDLGRARIPFKSRPGSLALQAALANRRLICITVFYGPAALGAKGLAAASLPMVVASTL